MKSFYDLKTRIRGTPQNHGPQTWFLPQRVGDSSDPSTQLSSLSQVHSSGIHVPFPQWNSLERQLGVRWGVNLKTSSLSHVMYRSTYILIVLQMANAYTRVPIYNKIWIQFYLMIYCFHIYLFIRWKWSNGEKVHVHVCWVYRLTRELFTHMVTSPLPVKGYKFWAMLGTRGHWAGWVLYRATPTVTRVISEDPWHSHLLPSV